MKLTQENRLLAIDTPLGKDILMLRGFTGSEGVSMPFSFDLDLVSEDSNISFKDIIGKDVTVSLGLPDMEVRHINGIISRFALERLGGDQDQFLHTATYKATMVPWLWLLSRTVNSRIFQEKSIPQIVEKVFNDRGLHD